MTKNSITKLLALYTALLSLGGVALAADLPSKKSPAVAPVAVVPAFSWTGCYVGLQAGATFGRVSGFDGASGFDPAKVNTRGFEGGGQAGCNYQMGQFVIGGEGDLWASSSRGNGPITQTGNARGNTRAAELLLVDVQVFSLTGKVKNNFAGALSVRGGFAIDHTLLFAKVGVAFANYKYTVTDGMTFVTGASNRAGLLLGVGVEQAIDAHWSVKLEYDNLQFGKHNTRFTGNGDQGFIATVRDSENLVKLGVNYRF